MNAHASVFGYMDYKAFLSDWLRQQPRGTLKRMAEVAGCQRSYLSEVLRRHVHLTPDHAFSIGEFLGMSRQEIDFFLTLVEYARASGKRYRESLAAKITRERNSRRRLASRTEPADAPVDPRSAEYCGSWHSVAIHLATCIPGLNTAQSIARKLMLPEGAVCATLAQLERNGFVVRKAGGYHFNFSQPNIHVPDDSRSMKMHHDNWRALVMSRAPNPVADVHYTSVFAVSKKDVPVLREQLLDFVHRQRRTITDSGCEEVGCFLCDLFHFDS